MFAGILHDFPERERARRDAFRRTARLAGYGLLRPGLLICPDDRWAQLAGRFAAEERDGRLLRVGLTLAVDDLRRVTADVWQLDAVARHYRQVTERTRRALRGTGGEEEGHTGTPALRQLHEIMGPIYDAIANDPALPAALLPTTGPPTTSDSRSPPPSNASGPARSPTSARCRRRPSESVSPPSP